MKEFLLYNTAIRDKAPFSPASDTVGMYCCGPTVYNYAHIGNMRTYIFEDVLKRTLLLSGYKVKHVVNITDVGHLTSDGDHGDDKMEAGAAREGKSVWDIAQHYTDAFMQNVTDLNILDADIWPKATDHIQEMIDMVQDLIDKGFTYTTSDGIYFDSDKFPRYGDFAKIDMENLQAGSRVEMGEKRKTTDFALWKFSPKDEQRAMEWESPWGKGFPGWHIECSAMSIKYLGQPLEIHCGGIDHVPIHHTNEIAQVEAATGNKYCHSWVHGEFLVMENGKMSKSKGSFITVDTLKDDGLDPLAFRLFCFSSHYRKQLTFSLENVEAANHSLTKLRNLVQKECAEAASADSDAIEKVLEQFYAAILNDMNVPLALGWLWTMLKDKSISSEVKRGAVEVAETIFALELFRVESGNEITIDGVRFLGAEEKDESELNEISSLINERVTARADKNWGRADEIRDSLNEKGVTVTDGADGVTECSF
jgi:cysteinyl-tRNA synthetase